LGPFPKVIFTIGSPRLPWQSWAFAGLVKSRMVMVKIKVQRSDLIGWIT
jgi:hypothetical protein